MGQCLGITHFVSHVILKACFTWNDFQLITFNLTLKKYDF